MPIHLSKVEVDPPFPFEDELLPLYADLEEALVHYVSPPIVYHLDNLELEAQENECDEVKG